MAIVIVPRTVYTSKLEMEFVTQTAITKSAEMMQVIAIVPKDVTSLYSVIKPVTHSASTNHAGSIMAIVIALTTASLNG